MLFSPIPLRAFRGVFGFERTPQKRLGEMYHLRPAAVVVAQEHDIVQIFRTMGRLRLGRRRLLPRTWVGTAVAGAL